MPGKYLNQVRMAAYQILSSSQFISTLCSLDTDIVANSTTKNKQFRRIECCMCYIYLYFNIFYFILIPISCNFTFCFIIHCIYDNSVCISHHTYCILHRQEQPCKLRSKIPIGRFPCRPGAFRHLPAQRMCPQVSDRTNHSAKRADA
jgi:hypothetical protein